MFPHASRLKALPKKISRNPEGGGIPSIRFHPFKGAMKNSVKSGEVRELLANKEIGNTTYQIGIVAYGAETLFGPKKLMARALIHNGKTKRWACDKTLLDIP